MIPLLEKLCLRVSVILQVAYGAVYQSTGNDDVEAVEESNHRQVPAC